MDLILSSKHLPFLSFQIVHHMHEGIILHHFFWLLLPPRLIQQLIRSAVCSGIFHVVFVRLKNIFHTWLVNLQCRNRWLFVSLVSLHKKHLVTTTLPFFCSTSWVRHAFLTTSQVKHLTFVGAIFFYTFFHILSSSSCITLFSSYTNF